MLKEMTIGFSYAYDENNRLIAITYPLSTVHYGYDATGKRTSMTDSQGTTQYFYDTLNRLITVDGPEANDTITYAYDQTGNRISMTNQDGGVTTYQYDALNRLVALTDPSGKVTNYYYDNVSNLTKMDYPNNTQANYDYDKLNRLIELVNATEKLPRHKEKPVSSYGYEYNTGGMRTKVTLENGDYINYTYDPLNRLTSEIKKKQLPSNREYYSYIYQFDPVGNRTSLIRDLHQKPVFSEGEPEDSKGKDKQGSKDKDNKKEKGKSEKDKPEDKIKPSFWDLPGHSDFTYTYNEENQLTQVKCIREETTYIADYQYDNNGNLISKKEYKQNQPHKAEITTYAYDYENRLTKITYSNRTIDEYKYDGAGKRIQSIENGNMTKYYYDGLNVIIERDGADNTSATYTRGLSYGGGIGGIISVSRREDDDEFEIFYYHYDGIGSVTILTDDAGEVEQRYSYDAYGNILTKEGDETNPYQFSTKEYFSKSGLSYFGARYYDSHTGIFIIKDSYQFANIDFPPNLHKYIYCFNNPVNFLDPWGLSAIQIPPHPPWADINKNIERARTMTEVEFYYFVETGGPWDYKQYDREYEDFGNFNYGATGRAAGFPSWVLLRMPGFYQYKPQPGWGKPWGGAPYGDEPRDQEMIKKGMDYYDKGLWEKWK